MHDSPFANNFQPLFNVHVDDDDDDFMKSINISSRKQNTIR